MELYGKYILKHYCDIILFLNTLISSAFDNNCNDLVVLKKLTRPFESKQHARRTYREIILLKHVSHHNIIQLIDIFFDANNSQDLNDMYNISLNLV